MRSDCRACARLGATKPPHQCGDGLLDGQIHRVSFSVGVKINRMTTAQEHESPADPVRATLGNFASWSELLPLWQRDALRRLYADCELSAKDLDELSLLCRQPHGLISDVETASTPRVLGPTDLPASVTSNASVTLNSIANAKNVNALADDQTLNFAETGLTVIYGDNGAGKSGYSRILKRACRARDQEDILPNAYDGDLSESAAATIHYSVGGVGQNPVSWRDGAAAADPLAEISVFDCKCAAVHVDGTNDLAYTPLPLQLLESLAQVCLEIAGRLKRERAALDSQTPGFRKRPLSHAETAVTHLLETLSHSTALNAVQELGTLSTPEREILERLKRDLGSDPLKRIAKVTATKNRVVALQALVERAERILAPGTFAELKQLIGSAKETEAAAKFAAAKAFGNEPLPQVGSEVWKKLWEAARDFSQEAYPTTTFPKVSDGAVCLLCQQDLSPEAAERFTRFEDFVRQRAQQLAEAAKRKVVEYKQHLAGPPITKEHLKEAIMLLRDDLGRPAICTDVVRCLIRARVRLRTLSKLNKIERELPSSQTDESSKLRELASTADARVIELQKSLDPKERSLQEKRLHELEDRAWLSTIFEEVKDEIARLKKLAAFDAAIRDTDTGRITRKATDVSRLLVTNRLRDAFAAEVLALGVSDRRIELAQEYSGYGASRFRITLIRNPAAKVARLFSEGEHRCVALAAFLAELATAHNRSGVILDDPVSSLDHVYRGAVVRRLVKEAHQGRQVIVFTHDIAFLMELDEASRSAGLTPRYASINRSDERCGICIEGAPHKAQPVQELLRKADERIQSAEPAYKLGQAEKWSDAVKLITSCLRDAWELALEKVVAPVVQRYSNKVHPGGLRKLVMINEGDYADFKAGYDFCCTFCHTDSAAVNRPAPSPDELRAEVRRARDWLKSVRGRQEKNG